MTELGHVVLYVRDLQTSLRFYQQLLGLEPQGSIFNDRAVMLTGGRTHHELLLLQVGDAPGPLLGKRLGLYHIGWKVGDSEAELRAIKDKAEQMGYAIDGSSDHWITKSLYLRDPDGNEIECYVDNPDYDWRQDDKWITDPVRPLRI